MTFYKNNDFHYTITEADELQRETLLQNCCDDREKYIVLTAVDDNGAGAGWLKAKPLEFPPDSMYITGLYVEPDHRCRGIGTALVAAITDTAAERGFDNLYGWAAPRREAALFWQKQGFILGKSGRVHDDVRSRGDGDDRSSFGNYSHQMFRNVREALVRSHSAGADMQIVKATGAQAAEIVETFLYPETGNPAYFQQNKDDLFGYLALDEAGERVGFALMKHEPMYPPLEGRMLCVWIYVDPEKRRRGIGTTLLNEVIGYAEKLGAVQLWHSGKCEELSFWKAMGFHTRRWPSAREGEEYFIIAGLRL